MRNRVFAEKINIGKGYFGEDSSIRLFPVFPIRINLFEFKAFSVFWIIFVEELSTNAITEFKYGHVVKILHK